MVHPPDSLAQAQPNSQSDQHDDKGHVAFQITYDDTGAVVIVNAPNGWRIREVIAEGYRLLGETPRPGDRVEADGVDLAPYLDVHVKQFVESGVAPHPHFNIVSNTGGATRRYTAASHPSRL